MTPAVQHGGAAAVRVLRWAALFTLSGMALAQAPTSNETVYRCGPGGGNYSLRPCADGRAVSVDDSRTDEQRAQALDAARRERALADKLTAERLAVESRAPAPAINLTPRSGQVKPTASSRAKKNKQRQTRLGQPPSPKVRASTSKSRKASLKASGTAQTASKRGSTKPKKSDRHPPHS